MKYLPTITASLFALALISIATIATAQPHFNDEQGNLNYNDYKLLINPASIGTGGYNQVSFGFDKQWVGIDKSPMSQNLQFQMGIGQHSGIGAWLYHDSYAIQNNFQLGAGYAHQLKMGNNTLSLGLNVSLLSMSESRVNNLANPGDLVFAEPLESQIGFNAGFGAYYFSDKFYAGFSIPQLLTNDIKNDGLDNSIDFGRMHYYFTGGYRFDVSNDISLTPAALLQVSGGSDFGYEFMLTGTYKQRFELGAGMAANSRLQIAAGATIIKNISLRYQFSQNIGSNYSHWGSSHFITLRFAWGHKTTTKALPDTIIEIQ